jgi:hypothetical protein
MTRTQWWLASTLAVTMGCAGGTVENPPPPPPPPPGDVMEVDNGEDAAQTPEVGADVQIRPDVVTKPDGMVGPEDVVTACTGTGEVRCGDLCIDTRSNNANCGGCSRACSGTQACRMGVCVEDVPCMDGQQRCGTTCVNTTTDVANCGACGNACPMGQSCTGGACVAEVPCSGGQRRCAGMCTDTASDANNCGSCGNACAAGQSCTASMCRSVTTCSAGQIACGGTCTNTMTDAANCGGCGNTCPMGQVCTAGSCATMACPAGQTRCGAECANTMTSTTNCGMCGRTCARGQTCVAGSCTGMMMCPAGQVLCGTGATAVCADTNTDPANCGMCGRVCSMGQSCVSGACVASRTCPTGQTDCTPTAPTATCTNLQTSATNCGACGRSCPTGESCTDGVCACAAGSTRCGRLCVVIATDNANCGTCGNACPAGQSCMSGTCRCATGQTLCGGACVNTMTDTSNCGMCGRACAAGQACTGGACGCSTGQTACGTPAVCVNTMTDRANCGTCGTVCGPGQTCTAGRCACPTGQTMCGTPAACVDTMTNAANCGRCANTCARGTSCTAGVCTGMPPANDLRTGATTISLARPNTTLTGVTTAARNDTVGSCGCTSGNDVFFTFTLTQPEIVYADTLGATWDTALFLQNATGVNVPGTGPFVTCNDDVTSAGLCPITSLQSQIAARLAPGTYYLVLSGCGAGSAQIHFQHLPAGNGTPTRITPNGTVQTVMGTTSGTGTVASTCCSGGADNSHWWLTCPNTPATSFHATSCSATGTNTAAYDNEIAQYSALSTIPVAHVCNDDIGGTCGTGASTTSTIPATTANQVGLNTVVADSCSGSGAYTLSYILANCASGARCGAGCVDTNIDANNCGGCARRCPMGNVCSAGSCIAPPANDLPAGAITINMGAAQSSFTVNTLAATNNTTGTCGCTSGRDVFYNFTISGTVPEMIYADTIGSTFDTSLFLQNSAGTNVTTSGLPTSGVTCNDDGGINDLNAMGVGTSCGTGVQSQILAQLSPGSYRLVLSGCGAGMASLRFQHAPVGNGAVTYLRQGSSTPAGTTSGAGRVNLGCNGSGAETTYYWVTCPRATTAGSFNASTCGRSTWDTSLSQYSPGRTTPGANVCADDSCGLQSSVTSTIPTGAGLHMLYVDGFGSASGTYTLQVTRP